MNKVVIFLTSGFLFIIGILFFAYQESWIIIDIPQNSALSSLQKPCVKETSVQLWIFKKNQWISETKQIIKNNNTAQTLQNLLNSWFSFLEEEQIISRSIIVDSVVISPTNTLAFISLNQNPLSPKLNTYESLMFMQGMLKTIKENKISIQSIQLLIQHQPLIDHRLNLTIPWPITGYTQS